MADAIAPPGHSHARIRIGSPPCMRSIVADGAADDDVACADRAEDEPLALGRCGRHPPRPPAAFGGPYSIDGRGAERRRRRGAVNAPPPTRFMMSSTRLFFLSSPHPDLRAELADVDEARRLDAGCGRRAIGALARQSAEREKGRCSRCGRPSSFCRRRSACGAPRARSSSRLPRRRPGRRHRRGPLPGARPPRACAPPGAVVSATPSCRAGRGRVVGDRSELPNSRGRRLALCGADAGTEAGRRRAARRA